MIQYAVLPPEATNLACSRCCRTVQPCSVFSSDNIPPKEILIDPATPKPDIFCFECSIINFLQNNTYNDSLKNALKDHISKLVDNDWNVRDKIGMLTRMEISNALRGGEAHDIMEQSIRTTIRQIMREEAADPNGPFSP